MKDSAQWIEDLALEERANSGFHIALRVGFAFPEYERNTYPRAWVHRYTSEGMMMFDPVTRWVYENEGKIRWSEIDSEDPRQVLPAAYEHGLRFGAAVSLRDPTNSSLRSFGSFARSDREFTDAEMAGLRDDLLSLHESLMPPENLTEAELEALQLLKAGLLMKEVAHELGITESAVKQRLKNAKTKLSARTTTQAVLQVTQFGWIK